LPGTIVSVDTDGARIALRGASVLVRRMRLESTSKKVTAAELAASGNLQSGTKLD
jgi:hypothetical protein